VKSKYTGESRLSGIYEIVNLVNGKRYIGSAVVFKARWYTHRRELRAGTHHARKLQGAWNKSGESEFVFRILEIVDDRDDLLAWEQAYFEIEGEKPEYNSRLFAGGGQVRKNSLLCASEKHPWVKGQRQCRECSLPGHRVACKAWVQENPEEHRKHKRESAMRRANELRPERVRRSPRGTRNPKPYIPKPQTGLCNNGLHPKTPGKCEECNRDRVKRGNDQRPRAYRGEIPDKRKTGERATRWVDADGNPRPRTYGPLCRNKLHPIDGPGLCVPCSKVSDAAANSRRATLANGGKTVDGRKTKHT
jgi:group I intron endonuclease